LISVHQAVVPLVQTSMAYKEDIKRQVLYIIQDLAGLQNMVMESPPLVEQQRKIQSQLECQADALEKELKGAYDDVAALTAQVTELQLRTTDLNRTAQEAYRQEQRANGLASELEQMKEGYSSEISRLQTLLSEEKAKRLTLETRHIKVANDAAEHKKKATEMMLSLQSDLEQAHSAASRLITPGRSLPKWASVPPKMQRLSSSEIACKFCHEHAEEIQRLTEELADARKSLKDLEKMLAAASDKKERAVKELKSAGQKHQAVILELLQLVQSVMNAKAGADLQQTKRQSNLLARFVQELQDDDVDSVASQSLLGSLNTILRAQGTQGSDSHGRQTSD